LLCRPILHLTRNRGQLLFFGDVRQAKPIAILARPPPRQLEIDPLVELDRVDMPIEPRQHHAARLRERRRVAHRKVVDDVVFVEADNHQVRFERRPEFEQLREFLAGVVARHTEIPDLPVDVRPPRFQALFEQERVRMFVDRSVAECHRIAQHDDADGTWRLRELIFAVVAKPEAVDSGRHAGEPAVVTRRELLHANGM